MNETKTTQTTEWLSHPAVGKRWGVSASTIKRRIKEKKLRVHPLTGRIHISEVERVERRAIRQPSPVSSHVESYPDLIGDLSDVR
jgi:hypothetical protein